MKAVIALGSNLQDPKEQLIKAFNCLKNADFIKIIAYSNLYKNPPISEGQPAYINAVVVIDSAKNPWQLLRWLQACENTQGRERTEHWGARTLDLDLIMYQDIGMTSDFLTLPHPRAHERRFVLVPWLEADPEAFLVGQPLATWLSQCSEHEMSKVAQFIV